MAGDWKGAIKEYDKAIALNPNHADAYYFRGGARANLKQYAAAIKDYNKAIRLNSDNVAAFVGRAMRTSN